MFNSFKPPKTNITPYSPLKEQRSMDTIKRTVAPNGGPLTVMPLAPAPQPQPANNSFNRLRAMFAKGR